MIGNVGHAIKTGDALPRVKAMLIRRCADTKRGNFSFHMTRAQRKHDERRGKYNGNAYTRERAWRLESQANDVIAGVDGNAQEHVVRRQNIRT